MYEYGLNIEHEKINTEYSKQRLYIVLPSKSPHATVSRSDRVGGMWNLGGTYPPKLLG